MGFIWDFWHCWKCSRAREKGISPGMWQCRVVLISGIPALAVVGIGTGNGYGAGSLICLGFVSNTEKFLFLRRGCRFPHIQSQLAQGLLQGEPKMGWKSVQEWIFLKMVVWEEFPASWNGKTVRECWDLGWRAPESGVLLPGMPTYSQIAPWTHPW